MAVTIGTAPLSVDTGRVRTFLRAALLDHTSHAYAVTLRAIVALILLSVLAVVVETVDSIYQPYRQLIDGLEVLILAAFTAEYIATIYASENRRRYILSFWGLVDFLAIAPGFLGLFRLPQIRAVRVLRVLRILRALKLTKVAALRARQSTARMEARHNSFTLDIQIYFIALFTVVVIASTLGYYAENDVPGTKFTSIPAAMWWAFATITTTGYGDMVPVTLWGRFVAVGTMLSGLALFGILTSVIGRVVVSSLFGGGNDAPEGARRATVAVPQSGGTGEGTVATTGASPAAVALPAGARAARARAAAEAARASTSAFMRSAVQARRTEERSSALQRALHHAFVDETSLVYRVVSLAIVALVLLSTALVIVESVEQWAAPHRAILQTLDHVVVAAFTLEYVAYILVAHRKREYVLSFWGIVDLLAILPSYMALANFTGVKVVRTLRILRVLRILKLSRMTAQRGRESASRRENTFWIDLQIYLITLFTAVVLSSTLAYYAEHEVPGTPFTSIPAAMWWAIVTITNSGYGDMTTVTVPGRIIAGVTMITGLALFGILTSVIGRAMLSTLFGHSGNAEDSAAPEAPPA